jgi:hypothetical protein
MRTVPDRRRDAPVSAGALARLLAPQLAALPPYPGGKRQLLAVIFALIARAIPRQEWSQHTFADAFFGGGAVGVAAQALGWRGVHVNDIAERSALVARALIANDHVRLHDADVLAALDTAAAPDCPELLRFLPRPLAEVIARVWTAWHSAPAGPTRDLLGLALEKVILAAYPLSRPDASDARAVARGDVDHVTPIRLQHYGRAATMWSAPAAWLTLAGTINAGLVPATGTVTQADARTFLASQDVSLAYLDPPYPGVSAYEPTFARVDDFFGDSTHGRSAFSGASPPLDELLDAAAHIPFVVLSYGNARLELDALTRQVTAHRPVLQALAVPHPHYAAIARRDRAQANREFLLLAGPKAGML